MPLKVRGLEEALVELLRRAAVKLPEDVEKALKRALEVETSEAGKTQLKAILENVRMAGEKGRPLCQDTGIPSFYVRGEGLDFKALREALRRATVRASRLIPLRPSVVHPLTRKNTGDNTGREIPSILWLGEGGEGLEITVVLKGAGSENSSVLRMIPPGEGVEGVKRAVLEAVAKAGGQPCPPTILNLGL
ncbi:MAG: fumarate hydratase, partial [Candidatus Hecatellales archaeon]